jgi:FkbM family methyltransferase
MSTLAPGDVFFDIGSDIGLFAILLAKVVGEQGQVIAFEPGSRAHKELEDNVSLNRLTNVRICQKALGQENRKGRLALIGRGCSSLLPRVWEAGMEAASVRESRREEVADCSPLIASSTTAWETVDIVEGDWLRESGALPIPRAVKIDVEGYEHFVLRGLRSTLANPTCQLLCVEIHPEVLPENVNVDDLIDLVRSLGFAELDVHPRQTEIHMIAQKAPSRGLGFAGGRVPSI